MMLAEFWQRKAFGPVSAFGDVRDAALALFVGGVVCQADCLPAYAALWAWPDR